MGHVRANTRYNSSIGSPCFGMGGCVACAASGLPQPDVVLVAERRDEVAVRVVAHANTVLVARLEGVAELAGGRVEAAQHAFLGHGVNELSARGGTRIDKAISCLCGRVGHLFDELALEREHRQGGRAVAHHHLLGCVRQEEHAVHRHVSNLPLRHHIKTAQHVCGFGVPHLDGAVTAACDNVQAVLAEDAVVHVVRVSAEDLERLAGLEAVQPGGLVKRGGEHVAVVLRKAHARHAHGVRLVEAAQALAAGDVPHLYLPLSTPCREHLRVG
mmetsp:Transcript_19408/g.49330  ORF Transcript_19408/g.49330 Transcript_19408/m.49330 type:complete len:272 (+) Transcript_19408:99-914(+)